MKLLQTSERIARADWIYAQAATAAQPEVSSGNLMQKVCPSGWFERKPNPVAISKE